ncbi:MAG: FecR domain-containing protein [Pseudomonadota bacterium]
MAGSYLRKALVTAGVVPSVLFALSLSGSASAQVSTEGDIRRDQTNFLQVADTDFVEVGITDVVQRQAVGTLVTQIRALRISDAIFFNEIVETGPESATRVTFLDDSSLSLGPSSEVVIDRFIYDPASNTGEFVLSLTEGAFRFASGDLDSESYTIETPVGTIGIRGTVIDVAVDCVEQAVGNCDIAMDVVSGTASFDGGNAVVVTPQGSRMQFRPAISPFAQVVPILPGTQRLTVFEDMGQRIDQSVVALVNGVLPPGDDFATASSRRLADAAVQLAMRTPSLGDLLVVTVAESRQDALGAVSSTLMAEVPASTPRVIAGLSSILGSLPASNGRVRDDRDSPFGDDDRRDNDNHGDPESSSSSSSDAGGDGGSGGRDDEGNGDGDNDGSDGQDGDGGDNGQDGDNDGSDGQDGDGGDNGQDGDGGDNGQDGDGGNDGQDGDGGDNGQDGDGGNDGQDGDGGDNGQDGDDGNDGQDGDQGGDGDYDYEGQGQ